MVTAILFTTFFAPQGPAEASSILYKTVQYKDQDTELESIISLPKTKGLHPGIIVVHDWMGMGPFVKQQIQKLSDLGYVAIAADIYGKAGQPSSQEEAGKVAGIYKADRALTRRRAQLAMNELLKIPGVDPKNIAVMGFCFGGMVSLELARSGADLKGVVTFHGSLDTPNPKDGSKIKAEVLALHGADDPYVPAKDVDAFEKEMRDGKVKWELVKYGGAVHAFTNPAAGNDNSKGAAYNAEAAEKSWVAMKDFFARIFKK